MRGIERGEQCIYITNESTKQEIYAALGRQNVNVDSVRTSDQFSILAADETYLASGEFDQERMLDFWKDSLASTGDNDFTGIRAAAEMTWALDSNTSHEQLCAYESALNTLCSDEDYVMMCQYNRERFPEDTLSDVIRTHPFLVADATVFHNAYYTSPRTVRSAQVPSLNVSRAITQLHSRTETDRDPSSSTAERSTSPPYRALFENTTDPTIAYKRENGEPVIQAINTAFEETFQFEEANLVGESIIDVLVPPDNPEDEPAIASLVRSGDKVDTTTRRYTAAGERYFRFRNVPVNVSDGPDGFAMYTDVTDQRASQNVPRSLLDQLPFGVLVEGPEREVLATNDRFRELFDIRSPSTITGRDGDCVMSDLQDRFATPDEFAKQADELVSQQEQEYRRQWELGDGRKIELTYMPTELPHGDGHLWLYRSLSESEERAPTLTDLHQAMRELVGVNDSEKLARSVVEVAESVIDLSGAALYLYDSDEAILKPTAYSDDITDIIGEPPIFKPGNSVAWSAFAKDETIVYDDIRRADKVYDTDTSMRSELIVPLGWHGILIAASTTVGKFDDRHVELVELLATHASMVLDQMEWAEQYQQQKEELEDRTTKLNRKKQSLDRTEDILQLLFENNTRSEIFHGICDELVETEDADLVWIGEPNRSKNNIDVVASAGSEGTYFDRLEGEQGYLSDGEEPAVEAIQTEETVVVDDIGTAPGRSEWRSDALEDSYRSVVSIPIPGRKSVKGVISIYSSEKRLSSRLPLDTVRQLGRSVGYAIRETEQQNAQVNSSPIEIEFSITTMDDTVAKIGRTFDGELDVRATLPQGGDLLLVCATSTDCTVSDQLTELKTIDEVVSAERITGGEDRPGLIEIRWNGQGSPIGKIRDHGGQIVSMRETTTGGHVAIRTNDEPTANDIIEVCTDDPDVMLEAYRTLDSEAESLPLSARMLQGLTDRQLEVLRLAYAEGFYDWPRKQTGEEIADTLDIAPATMHQHLRVGVKRMLEELFGSTTKE